MRYIKFIVSVGILLALLWFGIIKNIQGAKNVLIFLVWSTFLLSAFSVSDPVVKRYSEKRKTPFLSLWLTLPFDFTIMSVLIWNGYWFSGIAWSLSTLLAVTLREKVKELRAKNATAVEQ